MRLASYIALCVTLLAISSVSAVAQERGSFEPVDLPPGVLPLPEPGSSTVLGTLISSENATFYKEVIIPELYRLIRFNGAVIDAARRVKYDLGYDDNWLAGTKELANFDKKLNSDGTINFSFPHTRGFLFGGGTELSKEWAALNQSDDKQKAIEQGTFPYKVLWNINSSIWSQSLLEFHFRLLWLKDGKAWRNVRGNFLRVYPWMLDPNFKLPQLFREKFSFYYPEPLHGLAWLTFRFQNVEEDLVWAYSPAINKVRQLTGSNRADSLITSSFSAEDFFGWSGHPAFYKAKVESRSVTLVPFANAVIAPLDDAFLPCYRLSNPGVGSDQAMWNFETPKFPGAADWLPIKALFVPREVYKIELTTKDPYSLYGREIIYVDSETMLPYFKIVYDRAGRHWKTVITSFGFAATKDRKRRVVYPGFTIVLDMLNGKEFVADYSRIRYCDSYPQDVELTQLDPKKLLP